MSQMSLLLNASKDTKTSDQTGFLSDQNLSLQGRSQGGGSWGARDPLPFVNPHPFEKSWLRPSFGLTVDLLIDTNDLKACQTYYRFNS